MSMLLYKVESRMLILQLYQISYKYTCISITNKNVGHLHDNANKNETRKYIALFPYSSQFRSY
jgi:hypothetical protein